MIKTFAQFLTEGVYDPSIFKAVYLCGPAGVGKGYVAAKAASSFGLRNINSDDVYEYLLDNYGLGKDLTKMSKLDYQLAQELRPIGRSIMYHKKDMAVGGRQGLLIDTPGEVYSHIKKDKVFLESKGYECMMIYVYATVPTAIERNLSRERKLPIHVLKKQHENTNGNITKFEKLFGDDFVLVYNEDGDESKTDIDNAWKQVKSFCERKVTNPIAKSWIQWQLTKKDSYTDEL